MKCPKCEKAGCRYEERRPQKISGISQEKFVRKNFKAKCKFCGYEGEC